MTHSPTLLVVPRFPARALAPLTVAVATLLWAAPASSQEVQQIHRAKGADAWSLQLEEVLAIGSMAGDESFGRIMDIAWDSRGRFLVADDHGGPHVKVFGSDGSYVRTIGREGEGPGEFLQPWGVAVDASDSLYVWDARAHSSRSSRPTISSAGAFGSRRRGSLTPWKFRRPIGSC